MQGIIAGNLHSSLKIGNNKAEGGNWQKSELGSVAKEGKEESSDSCSPSASLLKLLSFNSSCKIKHPQTPLLWSLPWFKELQWIFFTVKSSKNLPARHSGLSIIIIIFLWLTLCLLLTLFPSTRKHLRVHVHAHTHTHAHWICFIVQLAPQRNNKIFLIWGLHSWL